MSTASSRTDADVIIIGSGAGGAAAAWTLARAGQRVLMLERGPRLDLALAPVDSRAFRGTEAWHTPQGRAFMPDEYYNHGGKTRWYGAALMRFPVPDFVPDPSLGLREWPFPREALLPWYALAETLLGVRTFDAEPDLLTLVTALMRHGWQAHPLPLALASGTQRHPLMSARFDGYALEQGWKGDACSGFLDPILHLSNFTLLTNAVATSLIPDPVDPTRISGVRLGDGREFHAEHVLLAAGAMHSPRLLLGYLAAQDLLGSLPGMRWAGRFFKRHIVSMVLCFAPHPSLDRLRKTLAFTHPAYPRSGAQALGGWLDRDRLSARLAASPARPIARFISARVYGFIVQTEDGSHPANRVSTGRDLVPVLDYDPRRVAQYAEHLACTAAFATGLRSAGRICLTRAVSGASTAHACGTLVAGNDPHTSVVDGSGKVHGLRNVWVMDGSALPRSGSANPALTIFAWALRAAHHLLRTG